ncbi:hypothetical protein ABE236_18065 [Priestia endophytica]|uniref:hypothetical protein n=1 Tax=Priestia endophytica TaxID=135735 RepID=UPI003D2E00D7
MRKLYRGQKVTSAPLIISDYMMCKKFNILPTAPTLYQEKNKIVIQFQIIEGAISKEEEREQKKQKKKGGKR